MNVLGVDSDFVWLYELYTRAFVLVTLKIEIKGIFFIGIYFVNH